MTVMADAFARAGLSRRDYEAATAALRFIDSGGDREGWIEAFDRAAASKRSKDRTSIDSDVHGARVDASPLPAVGHSFAVGNDPQAHADGPIPIPDAGQAIVASQGQSGGAGIRDPITSGAAKTGVPAKATFSLPPAREPSAADIEALKNAGDFSYFSMIKLRAKAWSVYRYRDLKNVRAINLQENMVITDVVDYGRMNRIPEDHLVSRTMPAAEMRKIVGRAKTAIRAHAQLVSKPAKPTAAKRARR